MYSGTPIFTVKEDRLLKETPLFEDEETLLGYKQETVITKTDFIECFNKWIGEAKPSIKLKLTFAEPDSLTQDIESEDDLCQ